MPKSKKNSKSSKTHKQDRKRIHKTRRNLRKLSGGSYGSDLRQRLVSLCKSKKWNEYDDVTQQIMRDYWINGKKDFFIHLDRNIKTFSPETLYCLKQSLTQLQEDAIPESMPHLSYIMQRT